MKSQSRHIHSQSHNHHHSDTACFECKRVSNCLNAYFKRTPADLPVEKTHHTHSRDHDGTCVRGSLPVKSAPNYSDGASAQSVWFYCPNSGGRDAFVTFGDVWPLYTGAHSGVDVLVIQSIERPLLTSSTQPMRLWWWRLLLLVCRGRRGCLNTRTVNGIVAIKSCHAATVRYARAGRFIGWCGRFMACPLTRKRYYIANVAVVVVVVCAGGFWLDGAAQITHTHTHRHTCTCTC